MLGSHPKGVRNQSKVFSMNLAMPKLICCILLGVVRPQRYAAPAIRTPLHPM